MHIRWILYQLSPMYEPTTLFAYTSDEEWLGGEMEKTKLHQLVISQVMQTYLHSYANIPTFPTTHIPDAKIRNVSR